MAWINTADWITLDHIVDEQVEMGLFVASSGHSLVTYKGKKRLVTTDVYEARGLTESAATTICANAQVESSNSLFVSASYHRANEAGAYTVRKVTIAYGDWENIPLVQQGSST